MAVVLGRKGGGGSGGGAPSGPAGGDLGGTYPNPTIAADAVDNTMLGDVGLFASYTPALTASSSNPTLGSGSSVQGRWTRIGDLAIVFARINWGTSGTAVGSGNYRISLPFTVGASQITIQGGLTILEDNSAADAYSAAAYGIAGQAYAQMYLAQALTTGVVTHAVPFAWAASDIIAATIICEIAP